MKLLLYRKFATLKRIGLLRILRCRAERIWFGLLARYFKFDSWHASAPFSCRLYKQIVVDLVNSLSPHTVVEVGCGLGDLLCRIDAPKRYGYDIDQGVVLASRFLHGRKIAFTHGDASMIDQDNVDVLIMVNWIHNLCPEELEDLLKPLLPKVRYLVLDAINPDGPGFYRYKHDFVFLEGVAKRLSITRIPDEPRSFHLFSVIA